MTGFEGDLLALLNRPLFQIGPTPVTLSSLALVLALVLGIWWIASLLEKTLLRVARRDADQPERLARLHLLSRLARYAVWVIGTIVVLNYVGIDLSSVALLGGAVAFGPGSRASPCRASRCAPTSTGSACTRRCGWKRTTASGSSNCAATSPARRCRTNVCRSTPPGRWS
jgi:hypothetical protein